jgi:hypothetical protein
MPQPATVTKAILEEIAWNEDGTVREVRDRDAQSVEVQFNPQTLRVNFTNQKSGGDQSGGAAIQFVGRGTTTLTLELWFDVTVLPEGKETPDDVRRLTQKVAYFITPKEEDRHNDNQFIPPGVRFIWGTFLFEGVMDSVNETLEFFSEDGRPLRASLAITISRQEIQFQFRDSANQAGGVSPAGTQPQHPARAGDSVQQMASRAGRPNDWRAIAAANNIENPRHLAPGTLVNLNA